MIQINNLSFYYNRTRPIFNNVSLQLKSGIYGLLGENGVGKTTLLHIISGLRFPKEGNCMVFGHKSAYRHPDMLSKIFFLPEEFQAPAISINEFVKYNSRFYPNYSQEQFDTCLREFQVENDRKMSELSFGQKKKTLISYALAINTPVTLLDEPTNGLDIPSKSQFRKVVAAAYDENRSIVISTHQVRDLESLIDPIIILDRNQVLLNNSVEEITRKLLFAHSAVKPVESLYCEQSILGYSSVQINTDGQESTLNIESLFNAVVSNKTQIKELFNI